LRPGRTTVALTFCQGGKLLVSAHFDPHLELWDAATGKHQGRLTSPAGTCFTCLACLPDGKQLAAGDDQGRIWLWDLGSAKAPRSFQGQSVTLRDLVFSPDGKTLVAIAQPALNGDHTIHLWDVATGQPLRPLEGHTLAP